MSPDHQGSGQPDADYQDVLDLLLAEEDLVPAPDQGVPATDARCGPISLTQRRMWFFEQWKPGTPTYHTPAAFWVDEPLDTAALNRAVQALAARHEALRTRFVPAAAGGEPSQMIEPAVDLPVLLRDVSNLPKQQQQAAALLAAEEEVRRPFALTEAPLARALVVRLTDRQLLVIIAHHLVVDGIALTVLLDELDLLYRAELDSTTATLAPISARFLDYALAERDRWERGTWADQAAYWRERLAGVPDVLDLPTDRPRPSMQSFDGHTHRFALRPELVQRVTKFSAAAGVTPFMTYFAAFAALLHRLSGQEDVVVGTPVATRGRPELERLVGLLVNVVPLRTDLSGEPSFAELLHQVRAASAEAYANQDVPFEQLVNETKPERLPSHNPIVQVIFGMQRRLGTGQRLGHASLREVYLERGTAKFDLTWSILDGPDPVVEVEYNTALYDGATIARLADNYLCLLAHALDTPDVAITVLDTLPADERARVLGWSQGAQYGQLAPGDQPYLPTLVSEWARRTPDAVAVTDGERRLSYAELDAQANRLARHLRAAGAGPNSVVGLYLPRGADLIVTILAVLRSGAAYLPLGPDQPADRIEYMLADAAATLVVTQADDHSSLPSGPWRLLDIDALPDGPADAGPATAAEIDDARRLDDIAYIIYTSGSTGPPKAVQIPHRNLSRLLTATSSWFGFDATDVWTLFHSYAFDFSVWEMWGALAYGGRLVVVSRAVTRSPAAFHELLRHERVTVLNQTPSAFRQLERVDAETGGALDLRLVVFGGEALDLTAVGRWFDRHGAESPRLVNMYGITETTVHVTYRPLTVGDVERGTSPIGAPIPDLAVYVLDRWGDLAPVGVPGELYVGGAGVARGYLGRPALTAERFVPDPFSARPGARMYRTGDVARRTVEGELEYLGRNDDQVKVRGFRIETGEVEAALSRHPAVTGAAVVANRVPDAPARLIAYVMTAEPLSTSELREYLSRSLPDYMVPAVFVHLAELPVTANGKIDRAALPSPDQTRPSLAQGYVAPRDDTEALLADVWAQVLEVDRVGVDDSFFDLGGDSIRSLQVVGLAKERGLLVTLQDLFRVRTIAGLALTARQIDPSEQSQRIEPFTLLSAEDRAALPDGVEDAYPMSVLQAGMIYHMTLDTETLPYHNVNSFRVRAPFDAETFRRASQDVVDRHPIMRTGFDMARYSEPMQLVYPAARIDVEVADLRGLSDAEQERRLLDVLADERQRPFDLDTAPLLRYLVHRRTDDIFQWTITEHHAIFDGWSLFSTQAEVLRRYMRLLTEPDAMADPPPDAQVRDFIALEKVAIEAAEDREYWSTKLTGYRPAILPRWPSAGGNGFDTPLAGEDVDGERRWRFTSTSNATHRSTEALLPVEQCDQLIAVAAEIGVPLKSVLLAAHLKVLSLMTGRTDLVAGVSSNGRPEDIDGTEARGMFLNLPPIRVEFASTTWRELVRRSFEAEQEQLPHRRYPLAHIQWDLGRDQIFDTSFLYNHFHVMSDVLSAGVEIIDGRVNNQAEYRVEPNSMSANCGFLRNPRTSQLLWRMDYYTEKISDQQAEVMRRCYVGVLVAMTRLDEQHESYDPLSEEERSLVRRLVAAHPLQPVVRAGGHRLESTGGGGAGEQDQARTPSERVIGALWSDLLGIAEPGRNRDFFLLGGHSLKAVQLRARINAQFDIDLPLVQVFRDRTVSAIARRVDELVRASRQETDPPSSSPFDAAETIIQSGATR